MRVVGRANVVLSVAFDRTTDADLQRDVPCRAVPCARRGRGGHLEPRRGRRLHCRERPGGGTWSSGRRKRWPRGVTAAMAVAVAVAAAAMAGVAR